jgi:hypothetical protein
MSKVWRGGTAHVEKATASKAGAVSQYAMNHRAEDHEPESYGANNFEHESGSSSGNDINKMEAKIRDDEVGEE